MKTEYNILWIDDDLSTIETDVSNVSDFLESFGIKPNIQSIQSSEGENIHSQIDSQVKDPNLDLIVVDYLMPGMDGRDLIATIRKSDHVFLPVIFYSSVGSEKLHEESAKAGLDGVYITNRDRLENKFKDVATSLLRKEQTSKRTRGLPMEGVSEVDANLLEVFNCHWDALTPDNHQVLINYFQDQMSQRDTNAEKAVSDLRTAPADFRRQMNVELVSPKFDTSFRWRIIKKAMKLNGRNDRPTKIFAQIFDPNGTDVPIGRLRNNYAHQTRTELEESHSQELCISIRTRLREQIDNLPQLRNLPDTGTSDT
jgi:CheY-like chemotaxis protein